MGVMELENGSNPGSLSADDRLRASLADAVSADPHPDDVSLIELTAGALAPRTSKLIRSHIEHCDLCKSEVARLQAAVESWEDAVARERRESRIGRREMLKSGRPWWTALAGLVSAAPLRPRLAAMAAGIDNPAVDFPVYEGSATAEGLSASIQRRGSEYYLRVAPSQEKRDVYLGRWVEVVLAQPETDDTLLERRVSIGQYVLLGTDLPISTELIAARLVSDSM